MQKEGEEGEKGLCQLSSKGVSKELAGEVCPSHRAAGKASLSSKGPGAQVESRVSISEERGRQILEGGPHVLLRVAAEFISRVSRSRLSRWDLLPSPRPSSPAPRQTSCQCLPCEALLISAGPSVGDSTWRGVTASVCCLSQATG